MTTPTKPTVDEILIKIEVKHDDCGNKVFITPKTKELILQLVLDEVIPKKLRKQRNE